MSLQWLHGVAPMPDLNGKWPFSKPTSICPGKNSGELAVRFNTVIRHQVDNARRLRAEALRYLYGVEP
jgi:hypothetical protein